MYLGFRIKAAGAFLAAVEDAMQSQSGFTLKQKQLAIQIKLQSLIALFPKKLSRGNGGEHQLILPTFEKCRIENIPKKCRKC